MPPIILRWSAEKAGAAAAAAGAAPPFSAARWARRPNIHGASPLASGAKAS